MSELITEREIVKRIYTIRGRRVMLDRDLAILYEVETGALNRAMKRNEDRFPDDFAFQLTKRETEDLRCQFGTANISTKSRVTPTVFTEHGILMLSTVLSSSRAVKVNIQIMRAFVRMRELLSTSQVLEKKIEAIERQLLKQGKDVKEHSNQIKMIFSALKQVLFSDEDNPGKRRIGFGND